MKNRDGHSPRRTLILPATCLALTVGCGGRAGSDRPGIWLITLDTTRADRLGCYGDSSAKTPSLDRFAREGARFEIAVTPTPLTLPAHASILTGSYPMFHGVRNNGSFRLDERFTTLAERLGLLGYETAAFVGSFVLDRQFGLAQGFDRYDDQMAGAGSASALGRERAASDVADAALDWLEGAESRSRPLFLWTHFYDPHDPYEPPESLRAQFPSDSDSRYAGEIAFVDQEVGRIALALERSSLLDRTIVIAAADHGEGLGEHGERHHGIFLYDSTLRVPLIVRFPPAVPAGRVVPDRIARLIDVVPTILDFLNLPRASDIQGESLRALIAGQDERPRSALAETLYPRFNLGWSDLAAIRTERWKWIGAPKPELYDLAADPEENRNCIGEERERAARLRGEWESEITAVRSAGAVSGERPLDASTRERLASLGYVWAGTAGEDPGAARPDPKDRIAVVETLAEAEQLVARSQFAPAAEILAKIIDTDPRNVDALNLLGLATLGLERPREARAAFEKALAVDPRQFLVRTNLASVLRQTGDVFDLASAEAEYRRVLAENPMCAEAHLGLGDLLLMLKRDTEARASLLEAQRLGIATADLLCALGQADAHLGNLEVSEAEYREAIRLDPRSRKAHNNLGLLLLNRRDAAGAIEEFRQAVSCDPRFAIGFANLGRAYLAAADPRLAVESFRRAVSLAPDMPEAHLELARTLVTLGERREAVESFDRFLALFPEGGDREVRALIEAERDALE